MEATGVGMMMVDTAWEGQVLGEYRSTSDECFCYVAPERPTADLARPITTLAGANALLEGYNSLEILKCFQQHPYKFLLPSPVS